MAVTHEVLSIGTGALVLVKQRNEKIPILGLIRPIGVFVHH
jgi:hypothetical protein